MKVKIDTKEEDLAFRAVLLKDIPYFHKLYAKYKMPISLEIARTLGTVATKIKQKHGG